MRLTFVNVGYGEAMVLECPAPGGVFTMVIDGGSAEAEEYACGDSGRIPLADCLARRGVERVDLMVSTHIHEDHICGLLPVAERLAPQTLWQTLPAGFHLRMGPLDPALAETPSQGKFLRALAAYRSLCALVGDRGGTVKTVLGGEILEPCPGLTVRVLAPGAARSEELAALCAGLYAPLEPMEFRRRLAALDAMMNNFSLMLLIEYHGTRLLLPGDTNCLGYGGISREDLRAHLFKVGHHGQRDGATEELLADIRPKMAVCCASSDRRYNSADADVLKMMARSGAALYFSDCPRVPGVTDGLRPHWGLEFTVGGGGALQARYLVK